MCVFTYFTVRIITKLKDNQNIIVRNNKNNRLNYINILFIFKVVDKIIIFKRSGVAYLIEIKKRNRWAIKMHSKPVLVLIFAAIFYF